MTETASRFGKRRDLSQSVARTLTAIDRLDARMTLVFTPKPRTVDETLKRLDIARETLRLAEERTRLSKTSPQDLLQYLENGQRLRANMLHLTDE